MNHFTIRNGKCKSCVTSSLTCTSLLALNSIMDRKASTSRQILSLLLAIWGRTLLTKSWVLMAFCTSLICPSWLQKFQIRKNLQRRILHALFCIVLSILYYCTQRKDFFINGFDINISIVSIKIQKTELALCRLSSIEHVRLDFVFGGLGIPVVR